MSRTRLCRVQCVPMSHTRPQNTVYSRALARRKQQTIWISLGFVRPDQHQPLWENAQVLDIAANKTILLIKEAMHIHMAKSSLMNQDRGIPIADCWKPILNRACHATPTFSWHHTFYLCNRYFFSAFCQLYPDEGCRIAAETLVSLHGIFIKTQAGI